MNSQSGTGPIYIHEILHKLQTGIGTRPRPIPGGDGMEQVPIQILIQFPGSPAIVPGFLCAPVKWQYTPRHTGEDEEGNPVTVPASLLFIVDCPDPRRSEHTEFSNENENTVQVEPEPVPMAEYVIPELAHYDPAIFRPNTEKPAGYSGKERIPNSSSGENQT